jgi:hypothetical protein
MDALRACDAIDSPFPNREKGFHPPATIYVKQVLLVFIASRKKNKTKKEQRLSFHKYV